MNIIVKPGRYVVAVSGGVDSMALLHLLTKQPGLELIVAHFEHGIRDDSDQDRELVQKTAEQYGLPFVFARGGLGKGASEAAARSARYAFLRETMAHHRARAIITAHHQDDLIETALINMLRGTGPRGLGMRSGGDVLRPLLHIPKNELQRYARTHRLEWREDSTNADERYLRNYLRRRVLPRLQPAARRELTKRITETAVLQAAIEHELAPYIEGRQLDRQWFIMLPYGVSAEAMAGWLRTHGAQFDRKTIHRLTVFAKTAVPGKRADISGAHHAIASKNHITLARRAAQR